MKLGTASFVLVAASSLGALGVPLQNTNMRPVSSLTTTSPKASPTQKHTIPHNSAHNITHNHKRESVSEAPRSIVKHESPNDHKEKNTETSESPVHYWLPRSAEDAFEHSHDTSHEYYEDGEPPSQSKPHGLTSSNPKSKKAKDKSTATYKRSNLHDNKSPTKTKRAELDTRPTPAPTGAGSQDTIVHITDESDFALLLPRDGDVLISESEENGIAYCSRQGSCPQTLPEGFIRGARLSADPNGKYVQITGCLDPSMFQFNPNDGGGQYDVRFPNGAQCTWNGNGGYGKSFIEQVEPADGRFCLRCCADENDQENCNSHQDDAGCLTAIPGTYDFGNGVSCE